MQRLNIPFSRHTNTTRRNRRVVWILILLVGLGGFLLWRMGTVWFSRGAILHMAPAQTILAIQFQLTQSTWPEIGSLLEGIPLISGRSLELNDIAPYAHGEIAVFVDREGKRSLALRASEEDLPLDLLNAQSIFHQQDGEFSLLSGTLEAITGIEKYTRRPFLPSMSHQWIGRIALPEDQLVGQLYLNKSGLSIDVSSEKRDTTKRTSPSDIVLGLYGISGADVSGISLENDSILPKLLKTSENIDLFVRSGETLETLVAIHGITVSDEEMIRELQIMGAFARPSINSQTLEDGSIFREIEVEPDLVSVEEVSTLAGSGYKISTGSAMVIAVRSDDVLIISNSEELLNNYVSGVETDEVLCAAQGSKLDPQFLLSQVGLTYIDPNFSLFSQILSHFSGIQLEFKKYSTQLTFCDN